MAKVKLNTQWLSGCGGCDVGIVDLHEKILDVVGVVEFNHFPVLTDVKGLPPADIGIITGAVRTEHDREAAKAMRAACKKIIAFGTCAAYGGISGASLAHTREELLERAYTKNPTTQGQPPTRRVSPLEHTVQPIDEVIAVDLYLPGCPPHATFIFDALLSLVEGRPPKAGDENVCGRCNRQMTKTDVTQMRAAHEGTPDPKTCFLSQGYACLGSVTLDRCLAPCPAKGVPCAGCAGPTMQVLTEPTHDIRTEVADRMASLTHIPHAEILATLERQAKTHYAYAMATRMIGNKPTFLIRKWIAEVEAR